MKILLSKNNLYWACMMLLFTMHPKAQELFYSAFEKTATPHFKTVEPLSVLTKKFNYGVTETSYSALDNTISSSELKPAIGLFATMKVKVNSNLPSQTACEGASGNQLINPSFEIPAQTDIGNNILTWPINGWNGGGDDPNIVKANGVTSTGGPTSAKEGVQYLDIANGVADFYQEFDFECNTQVFFSGYFSVRDGQSSSGKIDIRRVNSDNTTDIVASSNQLNMPSTANIWYLASGSASLSTGKYRFQISMGNHANFDSACFSYDNANIDTGSYEPVCESSSSITLTGTPTDNLGTWTGSGIVDNGDGTASFNPSGLGGTIVPVTYTHSNTSGFSCSESTNITVNQNTPPTFTQVPEICSGDTLPNLPSTSSNGVTGTWSPSLDNTTTTTYTFTPDAGQCAVTSSIDIVVNPIITPFFNAVNPICSGDTLPNLPSTSSNGVTGTWSPSLDNTTTTTYTFTPDTGQCAVTSSIDIVVNPIITPFFSAVNPICSGDTLSNLPSTSSNGVTGTWSPAMNNTVTTNYTFTPDAGQCAVTSSIDIVVNPIITPSFSVVNPICSGDTLPNLPSTSSNSITGTWSPAMNNTATTNYTFTPDAGQCAENANMTIEVNSDTAPTFTQIPAICSGDALSELLTISNNGIHGTWSPSLDNTTTTTYTFTPDADQCAVTSSIDIVVNPIITPFFSAVNPIRGGDTLSNLPSTSNNGIKGTWSPAMNNTATTNYTFTPDAGQCAVTSNIEIVVSNINNAFSPNGDGVNDIFIIPILLNYLDFEIEVFNRWGTKVYYYNNNGSTSPSWWDGYATVGLLQGNSKPLTVGTYYYIIYLNNKVKEKITGWIYLNR